MFNSVQYVRDICKQRKIAISQLEKECGFANGYLNPKKITKLPYDRAVVIANYLHISVDLILTGKQQENSPAEHDILDDVDVAFYGDYKELTEDDKETLRAMARVMKERRARKDQAK